MTQVSRKILGVAILCSLVLGVIAGYATHSMLTPAAPTFRLPSEIPIGYIHASPVQVSLAKPAITMFTEDVNKFVQQAGIPVKFVVWEENAEESPTKARERAETLLARGVQVLVGPPWSSQVKAIMPLVNDRKIPLISCCATSTELAIPGDYVFRLSPDDSKQALLWARILADLKIKAALPIIIQEEYSVDIFASIQKAAPNIVYLKEIPVSAEKKEFVGELTEAEAEYKEALKQYSRDEIAILLFVTDGGGVLPSSERHGEVSGVNESQGPSTWTRRCRSYWYHAICRRTGLTSGVYGVQPSPSGGLCQLQGLERTLHRNRWL